MKNLSYRQQFMSQETDNFFTNMKHCLFMFEFNSQIYNKILSTFTLTCRIYNNSKLNYLISNSVLDPLGIRSVKIPPKFLDSIIPKLL